MRHCAQGGKAAAETIMDMRTTGDYSKQSTKEYERRWIQAFGHDFHMVHSSPSLAPSVADCLCHSLPQSKDPSLIESERPLETRRRNCKQNECSPHCHPLFEYLDEQSMTFACAKCWSPEQMVSIV